MRIYFSDYSLTLLIIYLLLFLAAIISFRKKGNFYFYISIILLSTMAYLFDPIKAWLTNGNYTDLFRFFMDIKAFQQYGWNGDPSLFLTNYNTIITVKIMIYIIAKIGLPHLLPVISCLIVYLLEGKVLKNIFKEEKIQDVQSLTIAFFIFIALTNYKIIVTNIRMPIGTAIFFYTLYKEYTKQWKFKYCLIIYILLLTIHYIFVVFLMVRLASSIFQKKGSRILFPIIIFYQTIFASAINIFPLINSSSNAYIRGIAEKINYYVNTSVAEYSEAPIVILGVLKIILILYLIEKYKKISKGKNDNKELMNFSLFFSLFSLGSIWNYHLFHRMTNFIIFLIPCWYLLLRKELTNNEIAVRKIYISDIVTFIIVILHLLYFFLSYQYRVMCF